LNGDLYEVIAARLKNRNGQVMLFVSHSKIEGLMMPAEKPISRMPTLRLPSGKPNFERLSVKPAKRHEWGGPYVVAFSRSKTPDFGSNKKGFSFGCKNQLLIDNGANEA
jgi:hypothetical protein